jgi:hypothetical protein
VIRRISAFDPSRTHTTLLATSTHVNQSLAASGVVWKAR